MADENEQRGTARRRVFKDVKIVANPPLPTLSARMRDISETGAKLELSTKTLLPLKFSVIFVLDRAKQEAMLVWQRGKLAGISFSGPRIEMGVRKLIA